MPILYAFGSIEYMRTTAIAAPLFRHRQPSTPVASDATISGVGCDAKMRQFNELPHLYCIVRG